MYAVGGQGPGRLANVPLHGVEPVAPVRYVGSTYVLGGRQQVVHAYRNQAAQRDLERIAGYVDVAPTPGARVQVDPVGPDTYRVRVLYGPVRAHHGAQVLLDHG